MFNYDKIPQDMKNLKRWVLWKIRKLENGKTTKIPINAKNGYGAKSNDEETWVTFDYALDKINYYQCNGLGFMLGNGYFGVDIDHAIEDKDLIDEFVNSLKSYTEKSQSGEGIHIICKGVLPVGNRRKGNIEMYDSARFFAMTGDVLNNYDVEERTEEIKVLWEKYLNPKSVEQRGGYVYHRESIKSPNKRPANLSNDEVISKALESKNGSLFSLLYYGQWEGVYKSQSEADAAFCSLLAFWTGRNASQMDDIFRSSKLYREKWDSKRGQTTYGGLVIQNAIDRCRDIYEVFDEGVKGTYNPETGEVVPVKKDYDLNDTGNAQRFIDRFGENIRYNNDNKVWVLWDGRTWINDPKQLIKKKVDLLIEEMKKEVLNEPNEKLAQEMLKNIKHLSSNNGKDAMLKEAQHIGDTGTVNADYDKDDYLMNCLNGVIDLRTGNLLPHDRKYMMSKNTGINVDLDGECPTWMKALKDIFMSDELVAFIHKALGYTATGDTKEQCFFQCYGNGSNGKSVFLNTVSSALGDYGLNAQVESILTRSNSNAGNASPDIARMKGARFVRTNEPNEGARFNEGFVKQLTGSDASMTARFLYGKDFEFRPILKLWIACNYKIVVRGTDKGIWRRQRLIPFLATFEGKNDDKNIELKLKAELPQILGWIVKGCLIWQKEGLGMPKEVEQATAEYRNEMDIIQSFIDECVRLTPSGREKAGDVFTAYRKWAEDGKEYVMTKSKFGVELGKRFEKKNVHGYIYYLGFILKQNDKGYVYEKE